MMTEQGSDHYPNEPCRWCGHREHDHHHSAEPRWCGAAFTLLGWTACPCPGFAVETPDHYRTWSSMSFREQVAEVSDLQLRDAKSSHE